MDVKWISTEDEFNVVLKDNIGVLFYFSTVSCSVGEALEPKVMDLMEKEYLKIQYCHIDMNASPEISANNNVFVEPTILVFFEGKETIRKSRIVSIPDLSKAISRVYNLAFE